MQHQSVTVEQFFKEHAEALQMRLLTGERSLKRIIREATVNRPGLVLSGFTQYFAYKRVQVFGNAEVSYLRSLKPAERATRYTHFFTFRIPCIVFSRGFRPDKEFMAAAEKAGVPVFSVPDGHHEIHQRRDAGARHHVRSAKFGDGQHGGHTRVWAC